MSTGIGEGYLVWSIEFDERVVVYRFLRIWLEGGGGGRGTLEEIE
jgi:hypothetical protein